MPAKVRVLLFASAREAVGASQLEWPVPSGGSELAELLLALVRKHPRLAPILKVSRFVRNGEYLAARHGSIHPGDEVAIHPPYGGG
ncbi:MAG: MoaD/ThiS family protein [Thermoplasmata archaeon]|nr:MoaD/ThiS family protein [Thermoplasmata archaeon]